ncbi:hypothetical protein ACOWLM_07595 [Helicobacter pylori]
MHISGVKTAFKIAGVEYVKDSTKLNFNYLKDLKDENNQSLSQNILTQNVARVYLIVVDGEIKKIGGSQADGGIKSTLNIYKDGGVKGRPSIKWNAREQGKDWPNDIKDEHANTTQKAQNREKAVHRKAIDKPSRTLKD